MPNAARPAHRTYARAFKQQVIRETLEPGMSVSIVARRHDINANVVFGWRKQYREGKLELPGLEAAPSAMDASSIIWGFSREGEGVGPVSEGGLGQNARDG